MKKRFHTAFWLRLIILGIAMTFVGKPLAGTSLTFHDSPVPVDAMLVKRLLKTRNDNDNADERSARQGHVSQVFFLPLPGPLPLGLAISFCGLYLAALFAKYSGKIDHLSSAAVFLPGKYYTVRLGKLSI